MSYITDSKGAQFSLFSTDTNPSNFTMCGQRFHTEDGREIVLFENGTVALPPGVLTQQTPVVANHQNIAVVAFTAASSVTGIPASFTATLGATKANQNQYQGGFVVVYTGTGAGQTLRIAESSATAASGTITITLEDSQVTALDATSTVNLIAQPFTGLVISPTTQTAGVACVTLYPVDASVANTYDGTSGKLTATGTPVFAFGVVQGISACLGDANTAAVGLGVIRSTTTAGAIAVQTATGEVVGSAYQASVSAKYNAIRVNL